MSIVNKKKLPAPANPTPESERKEKTAAPREPKKRRRLPTFAVVLLGLLLLIGLLPTILVHTPLAGYLVRRAARLDGTITFQSASMGWFSSTSISGIVISDTQGERVLEADRLTSDRSLWKLIVHPTSVGTLRIEKPRLTAKMTQDGSNVETLLARWLTASSGPAGSSGPSQSGGVDLSVEVADGDMTVVDQQTQQSWHVTGLQVALDLSRQISMPTRLEVTAAIDDRQHPGSLTWKSQCKAGEAQPADPSAAAGIDGDLSLQAAALPLGMFQRIADRIMPGLKINGMLDSNLSIQWTGPANVKVSGSIGGSDLVIASPAVGRDAVRMDKMAITCKAGRQNQQATIDNIKLTCDLGALEASGHVALGDRGWKTLTGLVAGSTPANAPANFPVQIGGDIGYQADLQRLLPWIVMATGRTDLRLSGRVSGTAHVERADGQIAVKSDNDIEQFAVATSQGQPYQDPRVHCAIQCSYQMGDNTLKIDRCDLSSSLAGASAGGQIALNGPGDVQLSGDLTYQSDKINTLLQPFTGSGIRISGGGKSSVTYRGPFAVSQGQASASLKFSGANLYEFQLGPGELKARLAKGMLQFDPLQVTCNQGHLALQPELRMDRQPMEFRLSAGTLASKVQLDQAACHSALRYVVPILASVTESQGQFSVVMDGCRIPIGDLSHAEIAGRIIVHSATVSPGPLVRELASLLSSNPSLVHIEPESVIQFRMTGGRIYHQGLALQFPDVTMRTYGSVGLDDSLKLMVETSLPLKWFPSNAITDALRGQKMRIPVGGTLQSPRLDAGELARVQKQVLGNLARGVLQSGLGNELNKLLQPQH